MLKFIPLFLICYIASCQTLRSQKTTSKWYQLQQTDISECFQWPLRESDLRIDEIVPVKGQRPGLLVSGLRRNNSPFAYFSDFKAQRPAIDDFQNLQLAPGQRLIGAHSEHGRILVASVFNSDSGSKAVLQLIGSKQNLAEYALPELEIIDGELIASRNGFWLLLKTAENKFTAIFVDTKKERPTMRHLPKQNWLNQPILIPSGAEPTALVAWHDDSLPPQTFTQIIRESGTMNPPSILPLVVTDLEAWAATARNQRLYVATVEGDTMVGDAQLKIASFQFGSSGFAPEITKKYPLVDVHTSGPRFLDGALGLELVLLNWIDEESTIARYLVSMSAGTKPRYSGVFPKGLRIIGQVTTDNKGDFVVTRHRTGLQWIFQQCHI